MTSRLVRDGVPGPSVPTSLLPERPALFDRVRGLLETDVLADRKVVIAGVGSGGSFVARELVKSGVGHFVLIDHDRLEVGNVCRHECGLSDLGRKKVHAVRDLLLDKNPHARVEALPLRIDGHAVEALQAACAGADLLVVATDNRASRMILNRIAVQQGLPTLFGAVFRRAYGGQVLHTLPGLTPCYQCFIDALPTPVEDQEVSSAEAASPLAYTDRPVAIEPGLSTDLAPVALLMVKLALLDLLGTAPTTLAPLRAELVTPLYLWVNRREPGTDYARLTPFEDSVDGMSILRWYGVALPRSPGCPVCGDFASAALEPHAADLDLFRG